MNAYPKSYDSQVASAFDLHDLPSDAETEWAVPNLPHSDAGQLKRKRVKPAPASAPTPTGLLVPDTITFAASAPGLCGHNGVGCFSLCCESVAVEAVDVPAPLKVKKPIRGSKNRAKGDVFLDKKGYYVQWDGTRTSPLCGSCALVGVAVIASYKDARGAKSFCSKHAKAAGTHELLHPCRNCPDHAKLTANYQDEDGNLDRLCSDHAKAAGTYEVQNPCRDCPDDAKVTAAYKDDDGNPARLCADHAKAAGTHELLHPCRDCPDHAKLTANYQDKDGNLDRLCADHARAAGTHEVLNPCRDCPDDAKLTANYQDKDGNLDRLCADHAVAAGTHVDTGHTGGSYEACQCFDRLERVFGIKLPHIHYHLGGGHSGEEQKGLLPAHPKMTPDCYVPDPGGASKGTVYQYHGNEFHGYPPGHAKENKVLLNMITGREAYEITQAKDRLYTSAGYRLFRIWGHEFAECVRKKAPRDVRDVCREFKG